MGLATFIGGIHPFEGKELSEDKPIKYLEPLQGEVMVYPLSQHIGAPAKPLVAKGDHVLKGQIIAEAGGFISANVLSSVSGTVKGIEPRLVANGAIVQSIIVENDNEYTAIEGFGEKRDYTKLSKEEIRNIVKEAGIVGLGGAGFPTSLKLGFDPKEKQPDFLIINGAECEPYITSDYRCFMEEGEDVLEGVLLMLKYLGIPKCIIGIEKNKPKAIEKMTRLCEKHDNITVKALKSSYPQGAEKTLIFSTTGRVVKEGTLPLASGCIVVNSSTAAFIAQYIRTGMPLVKRRITVDGNIVKKPSNFIVPVGMSIGEIVYYAELSDKPDRIILGGPMMGACAFDPDYPLSKTNNAVLMFADSPVYEPSECIRCGKCVRACSMNLLPTELEHAFDMRDAGRLEKLKVNLCVNCGACSFVCPAKRNLAEKNQLAKAFLREQSTRKGK